MEKAELVITALQQRIGEMAAQFELEKAMLRAEYTELLNKHEELNKQISLEEYSQDVSDKAGIKN